MIMQYKIMRKGLLFIVLFFVISTGTVFAQVDVSSGVSLDTNQHTYFKSPIHKGERSQDVLALQKILIAKGLLPASVTPTGFFGSATQKAVQQLQSANGIENADGSTVGPKTQNLLESIITELGGVIPSDPASFVQGNGEQVDRGIEDYQGGSRDFRPRPCGFGALFNSMNGQACPAPKTIVSCSRGDIYDALTGKMCQNNPPVEVNPAKIN